MMLSEQPLKCKQDSKPLFEDCFGLTIKSQEVFSLGSGPLIIGRFDPGTGPSGWKMLTFTAESKINRLEVGVGGRNLLDRGRLLIGRDVEITLQI